MRPLFVSRPARCRWVACVGFSLVALMLLTTACGWPWPGASTPTPTLTSTPTPTPTPVAGSLGEPPHPELLPPPELCGVEPELDLLTFAAIDADPDNAKLFLRVAPYTNRWEQDWRIQVRSGSADTLAAYTAQLQLCAEAVLDALPDADQLAQSIAPSRYPIITLALAETAAQTGIPPEDLSHRAETPRAIIEGHGQSPAAVATATALRLTNALAAGALDNVDPALLDIIAADALTYANQLLDESGLFLGAVSVDTRPVEEILEANPGAVSVAIVPAGQLAEDIQKSGGIVYYVVDPEVVAGAPNYFVAHCTTYAYAQAALSNIGNNGVLTLVLRKIGTGNQTGAASANTPTTPWLEGSSRTKITFDVEVATTQQATYVIYGNWILGAGGACVNQ